ncbi:TPA: hypothetical protein N0F65_001265 [Lagenidium giganteum]|uniref:Ras-related protein Rab-23 n=1 Tax=Lagenidium giganteum TaxID=4803 RepID=A0AAV2YS75_9STRA|nr:TPA: hypothetical protein N0F65_001265 [Lagenidium giganteum]
MRYFEPLAAEKSHEGDAAKTFVTPQGASEHLRPLQAQHEQAERARQVRVMDCDDFEKTLKVIVVGNGNVGKTSMTTRYAKGRFTGNYKKTIGVDFMEKTVELRDLGETIKLMIWDTAGQEEFDTLTSRYYKGAGAVIYVFSTVDRASFDDLPKWKRKVEEECGHICHVLVQNKIDLIDDAAMTRDEVEDMADYMNIRLFRSCVQDNVNVKEVFEYLCRRYMKSGGDDLDEPLQAVADISALSEATKQAAASGGAHDRKGRREFSDVSERAPSSASDGRSSSHDEETSPMPTKKPDKNSARYESGRSGSDGGDRGGRHDSRRYDSGRRGNERSDSGRYDNRDRHGNHHRDDDRYDSDRYDNERHSMGDTTVDGTTAEGTIVPRDAVLAALEYQKNFEYTTVPFNTNAIVDCGESLDRLRYEKREARERRQMLWEDHYATQINDEIIRTTKEKRKKLAHQTAMLAQLKTDADKWNMAIDLKFSDYISATLSVVDETVRMDYLASRSSTGQTPLLRSVKANDVDLVHLLLELGAELTARDDSGRTIFHLAAEFGLPEIFSAALEQLTPENEAILAHVDSQGNSIFHVTAIKGCDAIILTLLHRSTSQALAKKLTPLVNAKNNKLGETPLHLAAKHGHADCVRLLLQVDGAKCSLRNANGSNAVHLALHQTFDIDKLMDVFLEHVSPGDEDSFQTLEEESGLNSLHMAILNNFRQVALGLISQKRVQLNIATRNGGWSPLHLAVMTEEVSIIQSLIDHGVMVDMVDSEGQTALLQACLGGKLDIARKLIKAGANPAHQNNQAHGPLHYLAAFCHDRELLQETIARGADVNAKSLKLNTPLHFAAMNGNAVATAVLLEHGANASAINEDKRSAVYLAKKWRHRAVEELVKPSGTDSDERDATPVRAGSGNRSTQDQRMKLIHQQSMHASRRNKPHSAGGRSGRTRTPIATNRSEDSDLDSLYSFDDEEILSSDGPASNNNGTPQPRTFRELRQRFGLSGQEPKQLTPLELSPGKKEQLQQHLLGGPATSPTQASVSTVSSPMHFTQFTRRFLPNAVEIPWEMTVPMAVSSAIDPSLQRKLKPSIRTSIGLLRDHLAHAQQLNWPHRSGTHSPLRAPVYDKPSGKYVV